MTYLKAKYRLLSLSRKFLSTNCFQKKLWHIFLIEIVSTLKTKFFKKAEGDILLAAKAQLQFETFIFYLLYADNCETFLCHFNIKRKADFIYIYIIL